MNWWKALAVGLLIVALGLGYQMYQREMANRQALAYLAETVAYRLTNLTHYADEMSDTDWAEVRKSAWLYNSVMDIIQYGELAERIRTWGEPSVGALKLRQVGRAVLSYQPIAYQVSFGASTPEDRAKIQELARAARDAGFGTPVTAGGPGGWTNGRDWGELDRALDRLLSALQ